MSAARKRYSEEDIKQRTENARMVNKKKFPDGYIYVIRFGKTDLFKIGVSQNPKRRLKDLNAISPEPIGVLGIYKFKNVYEMEECVHDNFEEFRHRKEWFKFDLDFAKSVCSQLKELSEERYFLIRKT